MSFAPGNAGLYTEGKLLPRLPLHTLSAIVLFGQVSISPFLLSHCAEKGVSVSWLTENGRFLGVFNGPLSGNVLLRRASSSGAATAARLWTR